MIIILVYMSNKTCSNRGDMGSETRDVSNVDPATINGPDPATEAVRLSASGSFRAMQPGFGQAFS